MKNQLKLEEIIPAAGRSQKPGTSTSLVHDASCATPKATIHTMQRFIIALGIICPKHRQFLDVEISNKNLAMAEANPLISRLLPTIFPANLRFFAISQPCLITEGQFMVIHKLNIWVCLKIGYIPNEIAI